MTTKPKAKKFRIRRSETLSSGEASATEAQPTQPAKPEQAKAQAQQPTAPIAGDVQSNAQVSSEAAIAQIRREGLTGRQLRMARRVAQKNGLAPTSDFDAVRLLREKGIDPSQKANVLELVAPNQPVPDNKIQLPQTVKTKKQQLPSTQFVSTEERASQILKIQRDIAKRRRARIFALWTRLAAFVLLPTLLVGWYFATIATPMYATKSEFVIQTADGQVGSGLGGLFQGTGLATSQDSVTVQSYLQSRDAMSRLNKEQGFITHFQNPEIDALQRLEADATNEQAYKTYSKFVKIGYDPTEGIIKMEVIAADPNVSANFSNALVDYAEEQVDALTERVRAAQLKIAQESMEKADIERTLAQQRLLQAQSEREVFDPTSESTRIQTQIIQLDAEIVQLTLELNALLDNARPNQARVDSVRADIKRREDLRAEFQSKLINSSGDGSLAEKSGQIALLQSDLETRNVMLQQSMATFEAAQIEAVKQVRYLSLGVAPIAPDEATYPRVFENTALAFLIFSGIYLMISLTVSILREQVSS